MKLPIWVIAGVIAVGTGVGHVLADAGCDTGCGGGGGVPFQMTPSPGGCPSETTPTTLTGPNSNGKIIMHRDTEPDPNSPLCAPGTRTFVGFELRDGGQVVAQGEDSTCITDLAIVSAESTGVSPNFPILGHQFEASMFGVNTLADNDACWEIVAVSGFVRLSESITADIATKLLKKKTNVQ